jgi:hypothetical protein
LFTSINISSLGLTDSDNPSIFKDLREIIGSLLKASCAQSRLRFTATSDLFFARVV